MFLISKDTFSLTKIYETHKIIRSRFFTIYPADYLSLLTLTIDSKILRLVIYSLHEMKFFRVLKGLQTEREKWSHDLANQTSDLARQRGNLTAQECYLNIFI